MKNFIKIGARFQEILRFCPSNFNDCNIGIIDGKELQNTPFKLAQVE
jgi:hypothetical protein